MNKGFSIWLDVLRCVAAFAVLFGHMAHTRFTGGDYAVLRDLNIASDAVVVFFVISGVVIAYAAGRDGTAGRFAFNRATRLLSVIVPALILTFVLDAIGTRLDPSAYPSPYYEPATLAEYLSRGLTLTTEWTGALDRIRLGSNGPLWSLSYELAFYLLFGVVMFCRGWVRMGLLALLVITVGVPILALLPAWALGVGVYRFVASNQHQSIRLGLALVFAVLPWGLLFAARAMGVPEALSQMTVQIFAPTSHHAVLGYSDEVLWNMLIAAAVAVHLIGIARLVKNWTFDAPLVRWIAGSTFSLYVLHYPMLHFLDAVLPQDAFGHDVLMLTSTLLASFAFAAIFEKPIGRLRHILRRRYHAMRNTDVLAERHSPAE